MKKSGRRGKRLVIKKKRVKMDLMEQARKSEKKCRRQRENLLNEDESRSSQEKHVELN